MTRWQLPILGRARGRGAKAELPLPPYEMRQLVGPTEPEAFDQPRGEPLFPGLPPEQYESVFDFGCGCGRMARRLALGAAPMPSSYVGIDLHRGMIRWADTNLGKRLPNFTFLHHDVFNPTFNPDPGLPRTAAFPVEDDSVTLLIAWSVFTHLVESQAEYYLDEVARVLRHDGVAAVTWFLFEKAYYPMMQDFQNALYINEDDITNAVIFDREWLLRGLDRRGLRIRSAQPPAIRGFQWNMEIEPGRGSITLPVDEAPFGRNPPPVGPRDSARVGLD